MRQARQAKRAERAGGVSGGLAGRQRRRSLITSAAQKLQSSNNIYSRHSLTQRPRFMVHKKKVSHHAYMDLKKTRNPSKKQILSFKTSV